MTTASTATRRTLKQEPLENLIPPHTVTIDEEELNSIAQEKAGVISPFLDPAQLELGLLSWQRLYDDPDIAWCQTPPRYLMGPAMYLEPIFADMATHPVALEIARRVLETEIELASYHVVATPPNSTEPSTYGIDASFHVDHVIYSEVPVCESPDNVFVCIWINFHELTLENGPLALAVGTDKFNIGWEFFHARPKLQVSDMHWGRLLKLNVGPAGTAGVYSGKTWHNASKNCSSVIRKGLQLMYTPKQPQTTLRRPWFDIAGLAPTDHARLTELIAGRVGIPAPDPYQREMFLHERDRSKSTPPQADGALTTVATRTNSTVSRFQAPGDVGCIS